MVCLGDLGFLKILERLSCLTSVCGTRSSSSDSSLSSLTSQIGSKIRYEGNLFLLMDQAEPPSVLVLCLHSSYLNIHSAVIRPWSYTFTYLGFLPLLKQVISIEPLFLTSKSLRHYTHFSWYYFDFYSILLLLNIILF